MSSTFFIWPVGLRNNLAIASEAEETSLPSCRVEGQGAGGKCRKKGEHVTVLTLRSLQIGFHSLTEELLFTLRSSIPNTAADASTAVKYSWLNAGKQGSVGFLEKWKKTSQTMLSAKPGLCFSYLTSFWTSALGLWIWDAVVFAAAPALVSQAPCWPFPQVMLLVVEKPLEYRWAQLRQCLKESNPPWKLC